MAKKRRKQQQADQKKDTRSTLIDFEAEAARRHARWIFLIQHLFKLMLTAIICGTFLGAVYYGVYQPVAISAGKNTEINVFFKWIFDANVQVYLAWTVAAGTGLYARSERKKRLRERAEKDKRIRELESREDKNRTSSSVSVEGEHEEGGDE